jgi:Uncharacterised protein family UPF0047
MPHLSAISRSAAELIATATLTVETPGEGFVEITAAAAAFVRAAGGDDGVLLAYIRHTSASLVIQENADPDVQTDLRTALQTLAPEKAGGDGRVAGLRRDGRFPSVDRRRDYDATRLRIFGQQRSCITLYLLLVEVGHFLRRWPTMHPSCLCARK